MLSTSQFKLCISSFEFSLLFDSCRHSCPSCGSYFDSVCGSEVRISSVLVLLGIGSYLWYKYMIRKIRKAKESLDLREKELKNTSVSWKDLPVSNNILPSSPSTCSLNRQQNSIATRVSQQEFSTISDQATETSSLQRSLSLSSSSANESLIGDSTVAKLDLLLGHIEEIKKSVIEMDADLSCVENSAKKTSRKILTHSPVASRFIYGINEISSLYSSNDLSSSCPPTPTLEWDSNDINDLTMSRNNDAHFYEPLAQDVTLLDSNLNLDDETNGTLYLTSNETLSSNSSRHLTLQLIPYNSNDFSSDGLHSPSPSSSSGQGSDLPSPEEALSTTATAPSTAVLSRSKKVDEILKEIKRLGIADDLLNELLKQVKRDSAFFEE